MKRLCYLLVLLGLAVAMQAQMKKKSYIICGAAAFVSGMVDGTIEAINYHYDDGFKITCPGANDGFWDPAKSWKNKYRNNDPRQGEKFPGSTTFFAFTTDAYHLLRTTNRTIDGVCIAYLLNADLCEKKPRDPEDGIKEPVKKKFWQRKWVMVTRDFLVLSAVRSVGFHATYSLAFRKQR